MNKNKLKIFVSIPMNGRDDKEVKKAILEVMEHFPNGELIDQMLPDTGNRVEMLGRSIKLMSKADIVVFMPGWNNSHGCKVEYKVCEEYGIKIIFYNDLLYKNMISKYIKS